MKLFGKTHIIFSIITFVVVFLFNYIGNNQTDKIQSALLNAAAGVVGLSIGLFILYKSKDDKTYNNFD